MVGVFNASQTKIGGFTSEVATPVDTKLIAGPGDIFITISSNSSREGSLNYFLIATVSSTVFTSGSLSFGIVQVGDTAPLDLFMENTGTEKLSIQDLTLDGPNADQFAFTLAVAAVGPGRREAVAVVVFTPTSTGSKSATLTINHNEEGSPSSVALSGTGVEDPSISLSTTSLTMDDTNVGSTSQKTFTISNTGTGSLSITGITVGGTDASRFTVSPTTATIAVGAAAQTITVTFVPTSSGPKSASLSIAHNAAGSPSTVSLSGLGITIPVPDIDVLPIALNFVDVEIEQSEPLLLVIANRGKALLSVSSIASSNEVFKASPISLAIAQGDSQEVTVTFTPVSSGAQSGILTVTSDDPDEQTVQVALNGNGAAPVVPSIEIFPTPINFGPVTLGQTKTLTIDISNKGGGTLRVANIVSSSADFSISETNFTLKAGEKKTITITFAPSTAVKVQETLDIPSDDPDNKLIQVSLIATGSQPTAGPVLALQVNTLDFGQVNFGQSIDLNLPIKNEGTGPLNISNITSDNVQVTISPTSRVISPGDTRTFTVTYRPQTLRERSGNLRITSDDPVQPAVKIPWSALESVTVRNLTVETTFPVNGAIGVPLETELAMTFSEPIFARRSFVAVDAALFPQPLSGEILSNVLVQDEGKKVIFPVELDIGTFYRFVLFGATAASTAELDNPFSLSFSTDVSTPNVGSISGVVSLSGNPGPESSVLLYDQENALVAQMTTDNDGKYQIPDLPAGQYFVFAQSDLPDGGRASAATAQNPISLSAGQRLAGIDIALEVVDIATPGENPTADISIDLDPARGNQRLTSLTGVQPNQEITLAVYTVGIRTMTGYGVGVEYDTSQVAYIGGDEDSENEPNILTSLGGTMLFVKTPPIGNVVSFAGALLGPTQETAPDGNGLLGILRFTALDALSSNAEFHIPRVLIRDFSGRDTVEVNASASVSTQGGVPAGFDTVEVGWACFT